MDRIGGLILLALAVVVFGRLLAREGARTWDARWPGTRPSRRQSIDWAAPRIRSAASYGHARWTRSRPAGWLPARVRGIVIRDPEPGDGAGEAAAPEPEDTPKPRPSPRTPPPTVQGTVITGDVPPAPARPAAAAQASQSQSPTGRTTEVSTLVPGAEEMTTGMASLRAYAVSGNILAKQAALGALAEVLAQDAATIAALARSMEEESMYGPEITEPVAQMATALRALSTRAAEAESAVASLARMPVGELAASSRQAPDRREMSEAGGR